MERVDFINTETGDDLIVAFAISRVDPVEVRKRIGRQLLCRMRGHRCAPV